MTQVMKGIYGNNTPTVPESRNDMISDRSDIVPCLNSTFSFEQSGALRAIVGWVFMEYTIASPSDRSYCLPLEHDTLNFSLRTMNPEEIGNLFDRIANAQSPVAFFHRMSQSFLLVRKQLASGFLGYSSQDWRIVVLLSKPR